MGLLAMSFRGRTRARDVWGALGADIDVAMHPRRPWSIGFAPPPASHWAVRVADALPTLPSISS
eukprot:7993143-Pyramimonas_sp.AAC.1